MNHEAGKTHQEGMGERLRLASDAYRPAYHYLPPSNWMNDPRRPDHSDVQQLQDLERGARGDQEEAGGSKEASPRERREKILASDLADRL